MGMITTNQIKLIEVFHLENIRLSFAKFIYIDIRQTGRIEGFCLFKCEKLAIRTIRSILLFYLPSEKLYEALIVCL